MSTRDCVALVAKGTTLGRLARLVPGTHRPNAIRRLAGSRPFPLLAINAQTLRLANPIRPKTSPVTAALKTAARINTTPRH